MIHLESLSWSIFLSHLRGANPRLALLANATVAPSGILEVDVDERSGMIDSCLHCGRKWAFINNPISQYPNIILYRDTTFPISQYPNIPISQYIGILGYRDIPTRNNCSRRPAPTHMPSRPLVIGPPAHTVHRTAHSAWHVFSCPQGTKTHAKQNALCGGQYGPEAQ